MGNLRKANFLERYFYWEVSASKCELRQANRKEDWFRFGHIEAARLKGLYPV
ncbi:MAG: hypothetical protein JWQ25_1068 [Daejeonella sp.]|nr:hypothetical protein [Daejeonella sp.]